MTLDDYRREVDALLSHATYDHLPDDLAEVSMPACKLMHEYALLYRHTPSAEVVAGLRKILEAKDCMVRAAIEDSDARA